MAAEWDGKSRGTVFGFKIFVFFLRNFGITAAYTLMHFPILYFSLFLRQNVRGLHYYFRKRLGYSWFKSSVSIYKTYYVFGQTLIDKVAVSSGFRDKYTYEFDGEHMLKEVLQQGKGGILISAHMGNFELAQYFFRERESNAAVSIVITDQDHEEIKEYLERFLKKERTHFIVIKEDYSHIFEINAALLQNRIICITGDRYLDAAKCMKATLLGKKAKFPLGPFHLATRLQVPVLFVCVMREPGRHYHLYARQVKVTYRNPQQLLDKYVRNLERLIKRYPLQWFNFYDFWDEIKKNKRK